MNINENHVECRKIPVSLKSRGNAEEINGICLEYISIQKIWGLYVFMLTRATLIWLKYSKNSEILS